MYTMFEIKAVDVFFLKKIDCLEASIKVKF